MAANDLRTMSSVSCSINHTCHGPVVCAASPAHTPAGTLPCPAGFQAPPPPPPATSVLQNATSKRRCNPAKADAPPTTLASFPPRTTHSEPEYQPRNPAPESVPPNV